MTNASDILEELPELIEREGLMLLGVVPLGPEAGYAHFRKWLDEHKHAGMAYLENHRHCREDPRKLMPGANTAVIVGLYYYLGDKLRADEKPRIAQYARLRDYHKVMRQRGERILQELRRRGPCDGNDIVGRVVSDSAPVLERALAAKTGHGFIGKNTCFIHPKAGSYILLGELLINTPLPVEAAEPLDPTTRTEQGGCGTCRRCQVHCPTGALDEAYRLDAGLCLSYWTIEHRGPIPERFWPWLGEYLFGCDICQIVCPYNRGVSPRSSDGLERLTARPPLYDVATMDQDRYEKMFGGTPLTRAKRQGLVRNALIAMYVTDDPALEEALGAAPRQTDDEVVHETVAQIRRAQQRGSL